VKTNLARSEVLFLGIQEKEVLGSIFLVSSTTTFGIIFFLRDADDGVGVPLTPPRRDRVV